MDGAGAISTFATSSCALPRRSSSSWCADDGGLQGLRHHLDHDNGGRKRDTVDCDLRNQTAYRANDLGGGSALGYLIALAIMILPPLPPLLAAWGELMGPTVRRRPGRLLRSTVLYGCMLAAFVAILAPFAWLLISSVARPVDLLAKPLSFIPSQISLDRYAALTIGANPDSAAEGFRAATMNSLLIATAVTAVALAVGIPAAYALARLRFRGRGWLILLFMATYMLPPIALVIPFTRS